MSKELSVTYLDCPRGERSVARAHGRRCGGNTARAIRPPPSVLLWNQDAIVAAVGLRDHQEFHCLLSQIHHLMRHAWLHFSPFLWMEGMARASDLQRGDAREHEKELDCP